MWAFPLLLKGLGVFPPSVRGLGASALEMSYAPPPLMPRGSGGILGSVSMPQQQTPLHHPCLGVPPLITPPTLSHWFPVHWYVSGISVCYVGISLLLKGLGVFPPSVRGLGASALEMSYAPPPLMPRGSGGILGILSSKLPYITPVWGCLP